MKKTLVILTLILAAVRMQGQTAALPASVDVTAVGAATYTLPLEVVPGSNGVQPTLAIEYNSMGGRGTLGQKWSLQGPSAITRTGKSLYYDHNITAIKYDTTDRYALDGRRLLLYFGSNYHADGAIYCSEVEDLSRVTKHGTGANTYFELVGSDGSKVEYGNGDNWRQLVGDGNVLSWMVKRVTDANGNYMLYQYSQSDGEILLSSIYYTYLNGGGNTAYAHVAFSYENSASPNDLYVGGCKVSQSQRLSDITMYYMNEVVRSYHFDYAQGVPYDRLTRISLLGPSEELLSKTDILWYATPTQITTDENNVINNGLAVVAGNFDRDKIYDVFGVSHNIPITHYRGYLYKKDANGSFSIQNNSSILLPKSIDLTTLQAYDSDGDGIDEITYRRLGDTTYYKIWIDSTGAMTSETMYGANTSNLSIGDFDGDGMAEAIAVTAGGRIVTRDLTPYSYSTNETFSSYNIGDFNGDQKTDILFRIGFGYKIYTYDNASHTWITIETSGQKIILWMNSIKYSGDFNGDGLTDFLRYDVTLGNWYVTIKHGNRQWAHTQITALDASYSNGLVYPPIVTDLNGDGISDIVQPGPNYTATYLISKGENNETYQYCTPATFSYSSGQVFQNGYYTMGDFDGNGIADMMFVNKQSGGNLPSSIKYIYKDNYVGHYVEKISDDMGKDVKIGYSTISHMQSRYSGAGMNWMPMPLVRDLLVSTGLGSNSYDTTMYYYGDAQFDTVRHQFIGFALNGVLNRDRVSESYSSRLPKDSGVLPMLVADSAVTAIMEPQRFIPRCYYSGKSGQAASGTIIARQTNENKSKTRQNLDGSLSFLPYVKTAVNYDLLKNHKQQEETTIGSNWRISRKSIGKGYATGNNTFPSIEISNYTYSDITLPNGVTLPQVTQITTSNLANFDFYTIRTKTQTFTYTDGRVSSQTVSDGDGYSVTTSYTYNTVGLPLTVTTTPSGESPRSVTYTYDNKNRFLLSETNNIGYTKSYIYYDNTGKKKKDIDENGLATRYEYDALGRLTLEKHPDSTSIAVTYTAGNGGFYGTRMYKTVTTSGQPEQKIYYDQLGRAVHTYNAGEGYRDKEYDKYGRLTQETAVPYNSQGTTSSWKKWRTYQYDSYDRVVQETSYYESNTYDYSDMDSYSTDYRYSEGVTDKLGNHTTRYYDALGRVVTVTDNGGPVNYAYDRVTSQNQLCDRVQITSNGAATTILTDGRGNRLQITDPDAGSTTSLYNNWNELTLQINGKGDTTLLTYDGIGRVASKRYTHGNSSPTYTYIYGSSNAFGDKNVGKLVQVRRDNSSYKFYAYDELSRLRLARKYVDGNARSETYTYNSTGKLYTTTYPSGFTLRREYDTLGRLKYLRNHSNGSQIYHIESRNNQSQPRVCWFGFGTGVDYTYNDYGMLTQMKYGYSHLNIILNPNDNDADEDQDTATRIDIIPDTGGIIPMPSAYVGDEYSVLQYSYNDKGYITQKQDTKTGQSESYTYDALGRLTAYTVNNTVQRTFNYANNGNMTQNSGVGSNPYSYSAGLPHAVSNIVADTGVISSVWCSTTYNERNRPASIGQGLDTILIGYGDDLDRDQEIWKQGSTVQRTVNFLFADCEEEVSGSVTRYVDYLMADGRVVALHVKNGTADSIYYVHTDMLGSWERIVNTSDAVVQSSHFDPWGNRMSAGNWTAKQEGTNFIFRRGFTGHEHYDQFKVINMNARLYDPVIGRFFSPDPQVQNPYSTQGLNRYSYCGNNPVMYSDPDGELSLLIGGLINLILHIQQGDVGNFWQGLGYFAQGAIAGAFNDLNRAGGLAIMASGTKVGHIYALTKGATAISTGLSLIKNPKNAWRIFLGRYYFDENMGHGFTQAFTRYTTESLQTLAGYNTTHIRNLIGHVDRVDYFGGATFATDEYNGTISESYPHGQEWGVTLGCYINMSIPQCVNKYFRGHVMNNQLYMHEYGHTIQSQMLGMSYLLVIGLPRLISASKDTPIEGDELDASTHDYFYTETWANRLASWYFGKHYGYQWILKKYPLYSR
jgi:RHS repeat-associated protein